MHQYRYHIMAVYDEKTAEDPDKLGKHKGFRDVARKLELDNKADRNAESK